MEVKDAVLAAKAYLTDLLADERMQHLGLEEVEFDEHEDAWHITLGFSRPWNARVPSATEMAINPLTVRRELPSRDYRVVSVDNKSGNVRWVKLHDMAA